MNLLVSQRRRKRIESHVPREGFDAAMDSMGTGEDAEASLDRNETRMQVQQAVAMLDVERRTVVLLRDFEGMDYEAIAETLEIPVGTVRSRLHRARLELKAIWNNALET